MAFLKGYRRITMLDDEAINQFLKFRRFDNLYGFSRLLWSLDNTDRKKRTAMRRLGSSFFFCSLN
ncbi:hypothetical protein J2T13_002550 [Paenibacillus sp. DS2015]|uniref:hypothetical protein n=1 Tax=Paenibacillus sp. DS2015 TaxID=3373917 RepID=UPI003D1E65E2